MISPGFFFIFSKFWFSRFLGSEKAKNSPKWQKIMSVALQEPYIIWLSFMVHISKMMISPVVFFFIFSKLLIFWVIRQVKGQKMAQNDRKLCLSHTQYLRKHTSYDHGFWYTNVKWWHFHFSKTLIFQVVRGNPLRGRK